MGTMYILQENKLLDGKLKSWPDQARPTRCQDDKMTRWQDDKMTRWQDDNMTGGPDAWYLSYWWNIKKIFTQMVWRRLREIGWENLGCTLCWSIFDFMQLWDKVWAEKDHTIKTRQCCFLLSTFNIRREARWINDKSVFMIAVFTLRLKN